VTFSLAHKVTDLFLMPQQVNRGQCWVSEIPFLWELLYLQWPSRLWIFSARVASQATEATGDTVVEC